MNEIIPAAAIQQGTRLNAQEDLSQPGQYWRYMQAQDATKTSRRVNMVGQVKRYLRREKREYPSEI